ncbi:MAG: hypothetical protein AAGJ29_04865, partial [Pseudomonadota bacterium]
AEAADVLSSRPLGGWVDVETFLGLELLSRVSGEAVRSDLLSTTSTYLTLRGTAYFQDVPGDFETLYALDGTNTARVVRRTRGAR